MFTKDNRTETFLNQMGVEFRYTNAIKFSDLKNGWDTRNLARPTPKRDDAILEYATLQESGSPAPAVILCKSNGGYDVLDGIQRLASVQMLNASQLSAYIVTCDSDDLLIAIRVLANARLQGRPESAEWTRKRAVEVLVLQRGMSVEDVARMGGWRPSDIQASAKAQEWGFEIRCIGGPCFPDSIVQVIAQSTQKEELRKAPKPIAEFLNTLKESKLSAIDAEPFIESFFEPISKGSRRHEIYTERLEEFREEPEVDTRIHGRRGLGLSKDIVLRRSLKAAITAIEQLSSSGEPVRYIDEYFKLLKVLDKALRKMAERYPSKQTSATAADKWAVHE